MRHARPNYPHEKTSEATEITFTGHGRHAVDTGAAHQHGRLRSDEGMLPTPQGLPGSVLLSHCDLGRPRWLRHVWVGRRRWWMGGSRILVWQEDGTFVRLFWGDDFSSKQTKNWSSSREFSFVLFAQGDDEVIECVNNERRDRVEVRESFNYDDKSNEVSKVSLGNWRHLCEMHVSQRINSPIGQCISSAFCPCKCHVWMCTLSITRLCE